MRKLKPVENELKERLDRTVAYLLANVEPEQLPVENYETSVIGMLDEGYERWSGTKRTMERANLRAELQQQVRESYQRLASPFIRKCNVDVVRIFSEGEETYRADRFVDGGDYSGNCKVLKIPANICPDDKWGIVKEKNPQDLVEFLRLGDAQ